MALPAPVGGGPPHARRRRLLLGSSQVFDLGVLMAAFVFATGWRRLLGPAGGIALLGAIDPRALGVSVLLLAPWHVVLTAAGLYRSRRFGSRTREAFDVLRAVVTD